MAQTMLILYLLPPIWPGREQLALLFRFANWDGTTLRACPPASQRAQQT